MREARGWGLYRRSFKVAAEWRYRPLPCPWLYQQAGGQSLRRHPAIEHGIGALQGNVLFRVAVRHNRSAGVGMAVRSDGGLHQASRPRCVLQRRG